MTSPDSVGTHHTRPPYRAWGLGFLRVLAVAPGVLLTGAAFNEFARIYRFVPHTDVLILTAFTVVVSALICLGARANPFERNNTFLPLVGTSGLVLGFYGMGGWELSTLGIFLFPVACCLAYFGVIFAANASARGRKWRIAAVAACALAVGAVPAILIISGLHATTTYLPDLLRQIVIASVLSEMASATLLGLTFAVRPPSKAPSAGSITISSRPT